MYVRFKLCKLKCSSKNDLTEDTCFNSVMLFTVTLFFKRGLQISEMKWNAAHMSIDLDVHHIHFWMFSFLCDGILI